MTPCIFELDEETDEANGVVHYFGSRRCRYNYAIRECMPMTLKSLGHSEDWIPGTVCDECGKPLKESSRIPPDGRHIASICLAAGGTLISVGFSIFYYSTNRPLLAFWAALSACWAFDCLVREILKEAKQ